MDTNKRSVYHFPVLTIVVLVLCAIFGDKEPTNGQVVPAATVFIYLILLGVTYALSMALAPKPDIPAPATPDEFDTNQVKEGADIPVIFGTCRLKAGNVVWYGNVFSTKVEESSK